MVLPDEINFLFSSIAQDYTQTCSKLEQLTLALFMETGNYQTHIKKLRKLYSQKLAAVTDTFEREASGFIDVKNTSSGVNVILKVHSDKKIDTLKKEAEDLGIPIKGIENDFIMFYYNQIPLAEIPQILTELIRVWRGAS